MKTPVEATRSRRRRRAAIARGGLVHAAAVPACDLRPFVARPAPPAAT